MLGGMGFCNIGGGLSLFGEGAPFAGPQFDFLRASLAGFVESQEAMRTADGVISDQSEQTTIAYSTNAQGRYGLESALNGSTGRGPSSALYS